MRFTPSEDLKFFMFFPSMEPHWWVDFAEQSFLAHNTCDVRYMPLQDNRETANVSKKYLKTIGFKNSEYYLVPKPLAIFTDRLSPCGLALLLDKLRAYRTTSSDIVFRPQHDVWSEDDIMNDILEQEGNSYELALLFPIIKKTVDNTTMQYLFYQTLFNPVNVEIASLTNECPEFISFRYLSLNDLFDLLEDNGLELPEWRSSEDEMSVNNDIYVPEPEPISFKERGSIMDGISQNMRRKADEFNEWEELDKKQSQTESCLRYNESCRYNPLDLDDWCSHPANTYWGLESDRRCFDVTELLNHFEHTCLGATKYDNPFPRYPFDPWTNVHFSIEELEDIADTAANAGYLKSFPNFRQFLQWARSNEISARELTVSERNTFADIMRQVGGRKMPFKHVRFLDGGIPP